MRAFFLLITVLLSVLQLSAGTIHPGLEKLLLETSTNDELAVIAFLKDRPDIAGLDEELRHEKARLADRHSRVMTVLQLAANRSQSPLVQILDDWLASGQITMYKTHWIVNAITIICPASQLDQLSLLPEIDTLEALPEIETIQAVSTDRDGERDVFNGLSPALRFIQADRVWYELELWGEGVLLANLGSGAHFAHESLFSRWRGNFAPVEECWRGVAGLGPLPNEVGYGRGTHVTSLLVGATETDTTGVCPGARWIASPLTLGDDQFYIDDAFEALEWISDPDGNPWSLDDVPDVVLNDWNLGPADTEEQCSSIWWEAIDNCEAMGICMIFPAGNRGQTGITNPASRATSPTSSFSVGACDTTGTEIASYSGRGPVPEACGPYNIKPEITGPGIDLPGAYWEISNQYVWDSGTAAAASLIAGVAGLMRNANPDIDVTSIKEILMETALDRGDPGEDNVWGHGFVDAYAAVQACMGGDGSVRGYIFDGLTGAGIANVRITAPALGRITETGADGWFNLALPAGSHQLIAESFFHQGHEWTETISGNQQSNILISLSPYALREITGRVTMPDGTPREGVRISIPDSPLDPIEPMLSGEFAFTLPLDRDYQLVIENLGPSSRIPVGPDNYGYAAFDPNDWLSRRIDFHLDEDTPYFLVSTGHTIQFDWQTIDPEAGGPGTALDFSSGANVTQVIDLPFPFMYYGETFVRASVCSNGWVALGETSMTTAGSGAIPDPDHGPPAMLAIFWDRLAPYNEESGNISMYHDEAGGRFIIEYNHIRQQIPSSAFESFQLILLDESVHPTFTGDGAIIMQYGEVSDGTSCTTGIESPSGTDGLQYFRTDVFPYAPVPQTGNVILYTTGLLESTYLPAISDLRITNLAGQQIRLDWSAIFGVTDYRIEESIDGQSWSTLDYCQEPGCITSITAGTRFYRVRSVIN
jgi:hypothetical protein